MINLPDWIYLQNILNILKKGMKITEFIFTWFLQNITKLHRGIRHLVRQCRSLKNKSVKVHEKQAALVKKPYYYTVFFGQERL